MVELGNLCDIQAGLPALEREIFKENIDSFLKPLMKIGNFEDSGINLKNLCWIDPNNFQNINKFIAKPNEILLAKDGCTVGKITLNNSQEEIYFSSTICKLTPKSLIQQRYFFYSLKSQQKQISKCRTQGPIPHLETSSFKKLQVPLPSLEKQEKIANWLDRFRELTENISKGLPREILLLKQQSRYYREKLIG